MGSNRKKQEAVWLEETLFQRGDAFFDSLVAAIDAARRSIEMETFIFARDSVGNQVATALMRAARRGVRTRLLVDGVGAWRFVRDFGKQMSAAGVKLKVYNPLPWTSASPGIAHGLARFNRRNHRKFCLVDHEVVFVGSFNITEDHSERARGDRAWHDIGVRLRGIPIFWVRAVFESVWQPSRRAREWKRWADRAHQLGEGRAGRELVQVNPTYISRRRVAHRFMKRIHEARQRIWLVTPYFVPAPLLLHSLASAARRGVDVRIVVSGAGDFAFVPIVARSSFGYLLHAGVRIFENKKVMVHAKIAMIDDWARVGSTNLNYRSLLHDLELNVILKKQESIRELEERFRAEQEAATQIELLHWNSRSWIEKLLAFLLARFRRWF